MDTLENEQTLLQEDVVTKKNIRDKREWESDEDFDGIMDAEIDDEFNKYKNLATIFGENIFQYDEETASVKLNEKFLAKQEYLLCLYLQSSEKKNNRTRQRLTEIFEQIVGESLVSYLGDTAKYQIVDKSGINLEKFCKDDLMEKPHPNANSNFNDENNIPRCDLVAWKPLDDRSGKLILLVQCKSGKNWRDGLPVNLTTWTENLIDFAGHPVKIYAITDLLNAEDILARSKEKGLIFDRKRIVLMLAEVKNNGIQDLRKQIETMLQK